MEVRFIFCRSPSLYIDNSFYSWDGYFQHFCQLPFSFIKKICRCSPTCNIFTASYYIYNCVAISIQSPDLTICRYCDVWLIRQSFCLCLMQNHIPHGRIEYLYKYIIKLTSKYLFLNSTFYAEGIRFKRAVFYLPTIMCFCKIHADCWIQNIFCF